MTTVLKNVVTFTGLANGVPVSLPHLLNVSGVAVKPKIMATSSPGFTVTADTVNITVTRSSGLASVNVYVEFWHSIEDSEPPGGLDGLVPFLIEGGTAGGGVEFAPAMTVFVAQSWPAGADPLVYLTTVEGGVAQAATLSPSDTNKSVVQIYSGTYTPAGGTLTLVPNVLMVGIDGGAVAISGNVTAILTSAVNETIRWDNINSPNAANTITIDTSGKAGGTFTFFSTNCQYQQNVFTGRGSTADNCFIFNSLFLNSNGTNSWTNWIGNAPSPTGVGVEIISSRIRSLTFAGNTIARVEGGSEIINTTHTITLTGTATCTCSGLELRAVSAAAGCTFKMDSGTLDGPATGAGAFDFRGCNFSSNANLTGISGTCLRTTWTQQIVTVPSGAPQTFVIAPAYPDTAAVPTLQLVSGSGNAATTATVTAGGTLSVLDTVGSNTFNVSYLHP